MGSDKKVYYVQDSFRIKFVVLLALHIFQYISIPCSNLDCSILYLIYGVNISIYEAKFRNLIGWYTVGILL